MSRICKNWTQLKKNPLKVVSCDNKECKSQENEQPCSLIMTLQEQYLYFICIGCDQVKFVLDLLQKRMVETWEDNWAKEKPSDLLN